MDVAVCVRPSVRLSASLPTHPPTRHTQVGHKRLKVQHKKTQAIKDVSAPHQPNKQIYKSTHASFGFVFPPPSH